MHIEKLKKVLSLLLACVIALSLTACGKSAGSGSGAGSSGSAASETANNGFKYISSFTPFKEVEFDSLSSELYTEDGFYAAAIYLSGARKCIPVFIGYDGSIKELSDYTPIASAENADGRANYTAGDNIVSINQMSDGRLLVIVNVFENWNDNPEITPDDIRYYENCHSTQSTYARFLNAGGEESSSFCFDISGQESFVSAAVTADDTIIAATNSGLYAYSQDGTKLWQTETEDSPARVIPMPDGRVYYTAYSMSGGFSIFRLDEKTHTSGEAVKLPDSSDFIIAGDGKHDFYYSSGSGFYSFDLETAKAVRLFSWTDLNITESMFTPVYAAKDGSIYGYINESTYADGTIRDYKVFQINEVPASSVKEKKTLVLATLDLTYESRMQVIKFNRASEDYHIVINDYSQYAEGNDVSSAILKLETEILAGNCPDIIDLSSISVNRLAARGLLEDLYPYIDADSEIKREDLLPNILAAAENNGKLVSTVSGFGIISLAGASDIVGDKPGWTYDEFNSALSMMPEGCTALSPSTTRKDIINYCLTLDLNHYVDWTTGKCNFECEEFTNLLKFAKSFPATYDISTDDGTSTIERMSRGLQMLLPTHLTTLTSTMSDKIIFGEHPYTYVGYPSCSGDPGNFISISSGFGMSSVCSEKQGAWEFLRTFFTEDYQRTSYTIPSNKAVFDAKLKSAMTVQYEKDENGNYLTDENGEMVPHPVLQYMSGSNTVYYYALSQEDADNLVSLIENTSRSLDYDISIINIVNEQAEAFFRGQKSAGEVAKLIQSRVSIYVNEQR